MIGPRRLWAAQRGDVPGGPANFYKEVARAPLLERTVLPPPQPFIHPRAFQSRRWFSPQPLPSPPSAPSPNQVTVTEKDMQVYALLDRARRLREKQEQLAAEDEKAAK